MNNEQVETIRWFYNKKGKLKVRKIEINKMDLSPYNPLLTSEWLGDLKKQWYAAQFCRSTIKDCKK